MPTVTLTAQGLGCPSMSWGVTAVALEAAHSPGQGEEDQRPGLACLALWPYQALPSGHLVTLAHVSALQFLGNPAPICLTCLLPAPLATILSSSRYSWSGSA